MACIKCVLPWRALLDPRLDDLNLFRVECACGRHLQSKIGANQPVIQKAVLEAARHHAPGAWLHHGASAVDTQPVVLYGRSVAAYAVLTENRLHVTRKIHFGWFLTKHLRNEAKARHGGSGI